MTYSTVKQSEYHAYMQLAGQVCTLLMQYPDEPMPSWLRQRLLGYLIDTNAMNASTNAQLTQLLDDLQGLSRTEEA